MQKTTALLIVATAFFLRPLATQAQAVTDVPKATAARDSLLQMAASTRQELSQTTKFEISAPRMGLRRHVVQGYTLAANPNKLPADRVKRLYVWKQTTRYLRNGQIKEKYVAQVNNQKILQERRLNGTTTWMKLARGLDLFNKNPATNKYIGGIYTRDGYFIWNGQLYALPKTL
ncbi:hypothetical protein [Hymenobacter fodinae]|uniref:Uncharacterized protein n=1 Tax=Hymenobacter fodinae TaxID=2510796 RepID=A0A4Z0PAK3_9BACT|nr:hypothetical protein [Hymenobacter fodinae]TGE09288.1 hypothetical protein EU556_00175 [Hymenobacter fodinae]